tara:strand:+ start:299 stop:766 length:468 start_codon:yes stop_codon:yes gene_type:complete
MKKIKVVSENNESNLNVAIVVSRFNQDVTSELLNGAVNRLEELQVDLNDVTVVEVPGAVEIPLIAKKLAKKQHYDVIITLGAIIRGETSHYDYVCEMVSQGCQKISLDFDIPVIFGVLTTENEQQAWDRLGGAHGHKGQDAADAAIEMHHILKQI